MVDILVRFHRTFLAIGCTAIYLVTLVDIFEHDVRLVYLVESIVVALGIVSVLGQDLNSPLNPHCLYYMGYIVDLIVV